MITLYKGSECVHVVPDSKQFHYWTQEGYKAEAEKATKPKAKRTVKAKKGAEDE